MDGIFAALFLLIAVGATTCARLTKPDRNYWPMLRVMWSLVILAYGGSALALVIYGGRVSPPVRLVATAAMLAAVWYSAWFMRKRNRVARYVRVTVDGHEVTLPIEEYERMANVIASWAAHGTMTAATASKLRAALTEWDAHEAGRERLRRRRDALRRDRGIPDLPGDD